MQIESSGYDELDYDAKDIFWKEKTRFILTTSINRNRDKSNTASSNRIVLAFLLCGWKPDSSFYKEKFKGQYELTCNVGTYILFDL